MTGFEFQVRELEFYSEIKLDTLCCLMREGVQNPNLLSSFSLSHQGRYDTETLPKITGHLNRCREDIPAFCLPVYVGPSLLLLISTQLREERG